MDTSGTSILQTVARTTFGASIALLVLSVLTGLVVKSFGEQVLSKKISEDERAGPIQIEEAGTPCKLVVNHPMDVPPKSQEFQKKDSAFREWYGKWSWMEFTIEDDKQNGLFGLGGSSSVYTGRTREEGRWWPWTERKTRFERYFVLRDKGTYYISLNKMKHSDDPINEPVEVTVYKGIVSSVPFWITAICAVIFGFVSFLFSFASSDSSISIEADSDEMYDI